MKLLRSTENKITKDKNGENIPHLEIKVWFKYQNSQPLEIEDKINLTIVIK